MAEPGWLLFGPAAKAQDISFRDGPILGLSFDGVSMNATRIILAIALIATCGLSASAQLANPGFESNFGVPNDWTPAGGGSPGATVFTDADMPTAGSFFLSFFGASTGPGTPHSNEGGAGSDATGTAQLSQTFSTPNESNTLLTFDCQFVSLDATNGDFMEASVSDGAIVYNIMHLDASDTPGGTPSSAAGSSTSPISNISADLGALFPTATTSTIFTVTLHIGNLNTGTQGSRGYFDNFDFAAGTGFEADSVTFSDQGASQMIAVHTVQPSREFYNLISGNLGGPIGGGPLLGLYLDPLIFDILSLPFGTAGLHTGTDPMGDYSTFVSSAAVPSGTTFDYVLAVVFAGTLESQSSVKRYVWP
ncbi:MAG: hypothetical protein V3W41_17185 [Planctomycetota bacterium]